MGLDNGFRVKGIQRQDIPDFVELPFNFGDDWIDIAYYRKCWGLRSAILDVLHAHNDPYHITVDAEDIPAILRAIYPFLSKEYWEDEGDSIWTFEEAIEFTLIQQIINLKWLYSYMKSHPQVECYFYDSY